jgi:hypothetical protein
LYTHMKQNDETSYNCFKRDRDRFEGGDSEGDLTNVQCKTLKLSQ